MTLLDSQGKVTVVIYDYYVMYEYVLALVVCICLKSLMFPLNKWFVPVSFSLVTARRRFVFVPAKTKTYIV
jgi:hypothetical protein